jgi:hypothetical protein
MEVQKITMLREVSEHYNWLGTVVDFSQCINGHINDTYHVKVANKSGIYVKDPLDGWTDCIKM